LLLIRMFNCAHSLNSSNICSHRSISWNESSLQELKTNDRNRAIKNANSHTANRRTRKPWGNETSKNLFRINMMGNTNEGGLFAPIVVAIRPIIGVKRFNQIRGKAISLHSQVIGDFCTEFGVMTKQRQKLIKTAKANGGRLGFLA